MLAAFQHQLGAAQDHLSGILLCLGTGQAAGYAAVCQCLNELVHPGRAAAGHAAGCVDQVFRHGIQPPGRGHDLPESFFLLGSHIAGAVLDHAFAHGSRGVGHDADHREVLARHLLNAGNGQSGGHAAQHETARALVQRELQRCQQGLHHLGLHRQKDQVAFRGHLSVGRHFAAQFLGQSLCLGRGAVCQIDLFRVCSLAHGPRNCAAHVAAAQKTDRFHHNSYPPLRQTISACLHCKHAGR